MSYTTVSPSIDLTEGVNLERLGKTYALTIAFALITVAVCYLLITVCIKLFTRNDDGQNQFFNALKGIVIGSVASFLVLSMGAMFSFGLYERWRGCYLKTE